MQTAEAAAPGVTGPGALGFAGRLALATSLLIGIACTGQSWLLARQTLAHVRHQLVASGRQLARSVAEQAAPAVEASDVRALTTLAERVLAQEDVVSCRIFDASGLLLATSGTAGGGAHPVSAEDGPFAMSGGRWEFVGAVFGGGGPPRVIGSVEIGLSTAALATLRTRILTTAVALAALVGLLAIVAAVLLARAITGPLAALARAADDIAAGDLDTEVLIPARRDEIGLLAASFRAMVRSLVQSRGALVDKVRELERVNRLKSEFVATVSHELRTPLNVILGYVEMLRQGAEGPLAPRQDALLEGIERYSRLQLELITNVLDFSRLATGDAAVRVERFALPPLLDEIRTLFAAHAARGGVRLTTAVDLGVPELETDRVKLQEIVRNLVENALKFTDDGDVAVTAMAAGAERVAIEVRDTGIGIAPEHLPHVFEPFYQVGPSSTRRTGGVGLGLSIVQHLGRALGGSVTIASAAGGGTTVRVELPIRPAAGIGAAAATIVLADAGAVRAAARER